MGPREGRSRLLRPTLAGVLLLTCFGVGLAVGRSGGKPVSAPSSTSPGASASQLQAGSAGPARIENGIGLGFTHDSRGATEAASEFSDLLAGPLLTSPDAYRSMVRTIAAPGSVDTLVSDANTSLTALDSSLHLTAAVSSGDTVVVRSIPLAYRVDSYSDTVAVVKVWLVGLFAEDATLAPVQVWATGTYTLQWVNTDWRLTALTSETGPVPDLLGTGATDKQLPDQLRSFTPFSYASN